MGSVTIATRSLTLPTTVQDEQQAVYPCHDCQETFALFIDAVIHALETGHLVDVVVYPEQ